MSRPARMVGILIIVFAAVGIAVAKRAVRSHQPKSAAAHAAAPSVILFADLREANDSCGCGQIIRAVRAKERQGLAVREIDPARDAAAAKPYGVTVAPTVVILDARGHVVQRLAGESAKNVAAVKAALDRLTAKKRGG